MAKLELRHNRLATSGRTQGGSLAADAVTPRLAWRAGMARALELPALAALAAVLPASLLDEAIREAGSEGQRVRKLPPSVVMWLVVGMGLFRRQSIRNVMRQLRESLGDSLRWGPAELPHSTSIAQARDRLGWESVRLLFRKLADYFNAQHAEASLWRGLPVYALDGTTFKVADSAANSSDFGRPAGSRGKSGYPHLRAVVLMGAWTHLIAEVVLGPWSIGETRLAADCLLDRIRPKTLVLMDRAYFAFGWLADLHAKGTFFVTRVKAGRYDLRLKRGKGLGPGEHAGCLVRPPYLGRQRKNLPEALEVRVVTYHRKGYRPVTVVTNLLDRAAYPAEEVGALYHARWEVELGYRELKIHLGEERVLLRSKKPKRVLQEAYGLLIAYNCVRALMAEAAAEVGTEPRCLSFQACLDRIRWAIGELARVVPAQWEVHHAALVADLARCQLPPRRTGRRCPRAVKVKMSNYPLKRGRPPKAGLRTRQSGSARRAIA